MNAISQITGIDKDGVAHPFTTRCNPDVFRSRLIDKFAKIETWAVGRLRAGYPEKKMPPTLGLRLGAVKTLSATHPGLFKHAATAAKLIDNLRPFQELRSALAHSKLATACLPDGSPVCFFDRADADSEMPWRDRITLQEEDLRRIIRQVSDLANQLNQQVPAAN